MVGVTSGLLAVFAVQALGATPTPMYPRAPYVVKESHSVPRSWKKLARVSADQVIDLQIGVKQGNFLALERHLHEGTNHGMVMVLRMDANSLSKKSVCFEDVAPSDCSASKGSVILQDELTRTPVSDPRHHRYGQHLSADDVRKLVKPSDESLDLIHEWLDAHGITPSEYSSAGDWIKISLPIEVAERLLDTEYHTYEHVDGSLIARTSKWSLPRHLHQHIDTVQPTTSFFRARANKQDYDDAPVYLTTLSVAPIGGHLGKVCNVSSVTPECFETLYSTIGYKAQSAGKNKVAFANYLGEHPARSDLEQFLTKYRPEGVFQAKEFKQFVVQDGPGDYPLTPEEIEAGTSKEANLDVQAITGINWETPLLSYSTGGSPPFKPSKSTPTNTNEPYLDWLNFLLDQDDIPQVISTSYSDDEQTVPLSYAKRVCEQMAQAGARGTTLFFASGDSGVGADGGCVSNDGKNTTMFLPNFPPSCPYVTVVGATMNFEPEVVAYRPAFTGPDGRKHGAYTSGGGFSNYFDTPQFQLQTVQKYVQDLHGDFNGLYNKTGRAYPDISAQGLYFAYFWNSTEGTISGTSASTPLLSGIISLVNDARIAAGKSSLGWLNPWLYTEGYKGLNDITSGSAHGCDTDGFPAVEGWDPVTGLGTPVSAQTYSTPPAQYD